MSTVQTLHEYMMTTKSHEYLIAVVFLAAFILFWMFAVQKKKR